MKTRRRLTVCSECDKPVSHNNYKFCPFCGEKY